MGIPALSSVLLDTSACIYFLDGSTDDRRHREVAALVERAEDGALTIVLSPISVAELLVPPIRASDVEAEAMVRLFVSRLCQVVPATDATASSAALLRSKYGLRLPDAFVLASAVQHSVEAVVGNDRSVEARRGDPIPPHRRRDRRIAPSPSAFEYDPGRKS